MAATRKAVSDEEAIERALKTARAALLDKKVATAAKLGTPKVRPRVVAQLLAEGYEKAGAGVRVSLRLQGEQLVALGHHVPLTTLQKRLAGANAAETKKLAQQLCRDGKAHLVLRGKQVSLVPATEPALDKAALVDLTDSVTKLLAWLKKARADKLGTTVLAADLREALTTLREPSRPLPKPLTTPEPPPTLREPLTPLRRTPSDTDRVAAHSAASDNASASPNPPTPAAPEATEDLPAALRGAILALRDEDSSLAKVPDVSRRLRTVASAEEVREALLLGFRAGTLELRPEGGIGRLSEADAALCPRGAGGVPLSGVRLRETNS